MTRAVWDCEVLRLTGNVEVTEVERGQIFRFLFICYVGLVANKSCRTPLSQCKRGSDFLYSKEVIRCIISWMSELFNMIMWPQSQQKNQYILKILFDFNNCYMTSLWRQWRSFNDLLIRLTVNWHSVWNPSDCWCLCVWREGFQVDDKRFWSDRGHCWWNDAESARGNCCCSCCCCLV